MNKIKTIILLLLTQSCMIDELPDVYYEGFCDCIYFDIDDQEFYRIMLRPSTYQVGSHTLTMREYCEGVYKGELANCKSQ